MICLKLNNEPPEGLKPNLLKAMIRFDDGECVRGRDGGGREGEWGKRERGKRQNVACIERARVVPARHVLFCICGELGKGGA